MEKNKNNFNQIEEKKIIIGLSGGVDSAVSAFFLKKSGYKVIAVFMHNWDPFLNQEKYNNFDNNCDNEKDWKDAKEIAKKLDIEIHKVNFVKEYWDLVFTDFLNNLKENKTPNPDILCNKLIKFDLFFKYAYLKFQIKTIATGHYARIFYQNNNYELWKGIDEKKDQTYFLCYLNKKKISNILFPVGNHKKKEIINIAKKLSLIDVNKKSSRGICFIGKRNFKSFLSNYLNIREGDIIDKSNKKILGKHQGLYFYTIGQRHALNLERANGPYFIVEKNQEKNILFVAKGNDNQWLWKRNCYVIDCNWLIKIDFKNELKCKAKFRYLQKDEEVILTFINQKKVYVTFLNEIRAITYGQFAVFYKKDVCIGGGVIVI
jgi:tRNA-uridine 2-sulfurtransferase